MHGAHTGSKQPTPFLKERDLHILSLDVPLFYPRQRDNDFSLNFVFSEANYSACAHDSERSQ